MRIILDHVCPRCRIQRDDWKVAAGGTALPDIEVRPGEYVPESAEDVMAWASAVDQCEACGATMTGTIQIEDRRESGAPGVRVMTVTGRDETGEQVGRSARGEIPGRRRRERK